MTHLELYKHLNLKYPPSLSEEWDNDGLMCCASHDSKVKKVLLSLDCTYDAINYAQKNGFDVIITHHPLVFKPLNSLNTENFVSDKLVMAIKGEITIMSFHTRLDAAKGGVNDALAEKLGLCDVNPIENGTETPLCRIGSLPSPIPISDFAEFIKSKLGCTRLSYIGDGNVSRVAVLGGSGKDYVALAQKSGADTFVCGEIDYNSMLDWSEKKMNIIQAGHFETEHPVLCNIGTELEKEAIPFEIFKSNKIVNI